MQRAQAIEHRDLAHGAQIEIVLHRALQLRRILDRDHPIIAASAAPAHRGQALTNVVLPAAGRSNDEDVLFRTHRGADDLGVLQPRTELNEIILPSKTV